MACARRAGERHGNGDAHESIGVGWILEVMVALGECLSTRTRFRSGGEGISCPGHRAPRRDHLPLLSAAYPQFLHGPKAEEELGC
jgi:hypothetical protein